VREDQEDEGAGVVMAGSCGIHGTGYRFGKNRSSD
jgi:hypothetical protein